jgi:ornithine carbamoyltransferase
MKVTNRNIKHFIDLNLINSIDLKKIIKTAKQLKKSKKTNNKLADKNLMMIFEKTSTRTRVSFEVAINQLGGHAIVMNRDDMQLGKGETISDTAKVLSRFVDFIMIRANLHDSIIEFANNSSIPVINGLSNQSHPCQALASIMAIEERFGKISGKKIMWSGDQNNVLNSFIQASSIFDFELAIASPAEIDFSHNEIHKAKKNGASITLNTDPIKAIKDADVILTDTWFSMGDSALENDALKQKKINLLTPYQVNKKLMSYAKKSTIFSHCLPVYRGYEATKEVVDSANSIIFEEAENRLHIQKAILIWLNEK